jgi:AraC family transcriptional regulator
MRTLTNNYYLEEVNKAIKFIESNVSDNIGLKEISASSNLSKYHFHRVFKSIIGNTSKNYLTRLRLQKSSLLLKNTTKKIKDIAFDCGYTSPETFNRAFKSQFSITPSQFRISILQEVKNKQEIYQDTSLKNLSVSEPKIVTIKDLNLAYIRHFGDYNNVAKSFQKLMLWVAENPALKLNPTNLGIKHDNPDLTEESNIRFDACLLTKKEIQPEGEIGYKKIKGGKFAVFRYSGPYETIYPVYDYIYSVCLYQYGWELRDEVTFEWYIKSPPLYMPEQFVTDFYLPIV